MLTSWLSAISEMTRYHLMILPFKPPRWVENVPREAEKRLKGAIVFSTPSELDRKDF
jgi:hypothetical protein